MNARLDKEPNQGGLIELESASGGSLPITAPAEAGYVDVAGFSCQDAGQTQP